MQASCRGRSGVRVLNLYLLCFIASLLIQPVSLAQEPQWIAGPDPQLGEWQLQRSIVSTGAVQQARMKLAVDFARAVLWINERRVLELEAFCPLQTLDVTDWMVPGENQFRIEVLNVSGPSAVAIELDMKLLSGAANKIISDSQWQTPANDSRPSVPARELGPVRPELWGSGRRDISLSATENYEQWRQASGGTNAKVVSSIWTVPGFEFAVLHTAAEDEGSWISMAFDPQGKLLVSREDAGLLRLTLSDDHSSVQRVERFTTDLKECRGLAFHGSTLYANANNSRGLYSLQYSDDLASIPPANLVREFPGGVGHGRNDLLIDGDWLYTIHGDSVDLPQDQILDCTSPSRHWPGDDSNREGHLLRMHVPTGAWELVCAGLRNPYGLAAQPDGSLFTFDADNEYDMGTPWYRPTRYVPLLVGGDIGYRTADRKLPPRFHDQPENVPPVLTIGRSSPTAIFRDEELQFPEPYRQATFLLDWTYGRVLAVHQVRRGASWRAHTELFLQGRPLNVTDIACGPDGAMYLITGGRKTQSSVIRVWATGEQTTPIENETHERSAAAYSKTQVEKLRELEAQIRSCNPGGLEGLLDGLAAADPTLRHAARVALERLPVEHWGADVFQCPDSTQWLYGCLAMLQQATDGDIPPILDRWLRIEPKTLQLSEKWVGLRLLELCLRTNPAATLSKSPQILASLQQQWLNSNELQVAPQVTSVEYRQRLALLMGQFSGQGPPPDLVVDLLHSPFQEDQLTSLLGLRSMSSGWSLEHRRRQFETLAAARRMVGGEGLPSLVTTLDAESRATLSEQEQGQLSDLLNAAEIERTQLSSLVQETVLSAPRPVVRVWDLDSLAEIANTAQVAGNRELGRQVFHDAQCDRCHRIGSQGAAQGPDLTFVGRRFGTRDLLESILKPSQSVAENYQLESVIMDDGTVHVGRIVIEGDYRSETLVLQTDAMRLDSILHIDKRRIEVHQPIAKSPMPEGLLDTFTDNQIRDLLAYLQNPGNDSR
jgi:putative heme-binding domain-containing protein